MNIFSIKSTDSCYKIQIGQFNSLIKREHFYSNLHKIEAKKLFKQTVKHVVLEISSKCNRLCSFCPNNTGIRKNYNSFMDDDIFKSIIEDLQSIDYKGIVYWHLYNEPMLAIPVLCSRMSYARSKIPNATFSFNTNGDFLTKASLKLLADAGLNSLFVSVYGSENEAWNEVCLKGKILTLSNSLGLIGGLKETPGISLAVSDEVQGVSITICAKNLKMLGYDRGGLIKSLSRKRTSPCLSAFTEFIVDHNGYVLPCCNVYTDNQTHLKFAIGKLTKNIFDCYSSKKMTMWRRQLFNFNPSILLCKGCSRGEYVDLLTKANRESLELLRRTFYLQIESSACSYKYDTVTAD